MGAVPVDQADPFREGDGPSVAERYARTRQVTITANLLPGASQQAVQDKMVALLKEQNLAPQYTSDFVGKARELVKSFKSFMIAFLLLIISCT